MMMVLKRQGQSRHARPGVGLRPTGNSTICTINRTLCRDGAGPSLGSSRLPGINYMPKIVLLVLCLVRILVYQCCTTVVLLLLLINSLLVRLRNVIAGK